MEVTTPNSSLEWLAVTEVINKRKNAFYRANTTVLIWVGMILIVYLLMPFATGTGLSFPSLVLTLGFVGFTAVMWGVAFVFGYTGLSYASAYGMPAGPITSNTDMAPRGMVWKARLSRWGETLAGDLAAGRLNASESGVNGIIALRWSDVMSLSVLNSQTVSIQKIERFFHMPMAKREVVLHFNTSDDCQQFVQMASQRVTQRA